MFQRNVRIFNNNIIVGNKQKQRVTKKRKIIPTKRNVKVNEDCYTHTNIRNSMCQSKK